MKRIKITFVAVFVLFTLLYWVSLTPIERLLEPWALRKSVLYYTGIMSFVAMTLSIVLAMRLQCVERWLGGLDKHYRLHKWLGISAALFALGHWLSKQYKGLIELGLFNRQMFTTPLGSVGFFEQHNFFKPLESFAKSMGEWAIYALLLLAILALWKKFPYRYFFKTHRVLAIIYLILAFHTLALFGKINWLTPIGIAVGLMLLIGVPCACVSLFKQIGFSHRATGHLSKIDLHADGSITEVEVMLDTPWEGHETGQFAFVTFDKREGHHPFSLSSSWHHDAKLTFHIKQLGDYTRTLHHVLNVGDRVTVEGPYGKFQLKPTGSEPQIWIAGGIGITPFLSRLKELASSAEPLQATSIHLFFSARPADHALIEQVQQLTTLGGVTLELCISGKDPALSVERITQAVPGFQDATVWFCGAAAFGAHMRSDLLAAGLPSKRFKQELFEMR